MLASLWQELSWHWGLLSMVSTVLIVIALTAAILARYIRIMLNILADTPPPLSMGPQDFQRMEGEHVQFRSADGVSLHGMFLYGNRAKPRKGMIIFCHEFASDMYSCARYCRPLLDAGFDAFTFDFRGHGRSSNIPNYSPRQWPSDREAADVLGAFAFVESYLENEGLPPEVGIFGISRGAGAAILAMGNNDAVKCIVTDGAFSTDVTLESLMKRWAYIFARVKFIYENYPPAFWRFLRWVLFLFAPRRFTCRFPSVRKAIVRMSPRAMFFIHGERDSYIRAEQTRFLYALAPQPKYLWIVPGAKHNQSVVVCPDEYRVRTVAFFERFLTGIEGDMAHLDALTPSIVEVA